MPRLFPLFARLIRAASLLISGSVIFFGSAVPGADQPVRLPELVVGDKPLGACLARRASFRGFSRDAAPTLQLQVPLYNCRWASQRVFRGQTAFPPKNTIRISIHMSVHTHRTWHNYAGQPPVRNPSLAALPLTARPLHSSCTQFSPCQQQLRPFINTSLLVELLETADFQDRSLWLWRNEARFSPCFIVCGFSGNRHFPSDFRIKSGNFGDDGQMVERFVEIDGRVCLKAQQDTVHVASQGAASAREN